MNRIYYTLAVLTITGVIAGCSILPTETTKSKTAWGTFEEAQEAYDKVIVGKSDTQQLKEIGFNPETVPNIEILGYVEIVNRMSPVFSGKNLPKGFQECIDAKERCKAYLLNIKNIKRDRIGNVAADLLGFRKETKTTGWQLGTTIILVDDVVAYKSWVGIPSIEEYEKKIIPLGPLQNIGDLLKP